MSFLPPFRREWRALVATPVMLLAACAVPTVPPPNLPPPVSAAPLPASSSPASNAYAWSPQLEAAAQRLRGSLKGKGAEVAQTTDQRLWVSLPGSETFAPGRSAIKPVAGQWLDEVAAVMRTLPRSDLQIVGAFEKSEGGGSALALDRAASARDWLVMRGVPARRFVVSGQVPRGRAALPENRLDILVGEREVRGGSSSTPR